MSIHSCGLGRDDVARVFFSPREVEAILGISHAKLYRLIEQGRLDAKKLDNKTVITAASLQAFVAALPSVKLGPQEAA